MNQQNIDNDRLTAEADRIAAGILEEASTGAPDTGEGAPGALANGERSPQSILELAEGLEPEAHMLVDTLCEVFTPNWAVTVEERMRLSKAIARAGAFWMPATVDPKYLALMGVAGVAWSIAQSRKDPVTGERRPMKLKPPPAPVRDDVSAAAA